MIGFSLQKCALAGYDEGIGGRVEAELAERGAARDRAVIGGPGVQCGPQFEGADARDWRRVPPASVRDGHRADDCDQRRAGAGDCQSGRAGCGGRLPVGGRLRSGRLYGEEHIFYAGVINRTAADRYRC